MNTVLYHLTRSIISLAAWMAVTVIFTAVLLKAIIVLSVIFLIPLVIGNIYFYYWIEEDLVLRWKSWHSGKLLKATKDTK